MWTSDGHESGAAVQAGNEEEDCRADEQQQGDDQQLRCRLGKFTIGDEMSDGSVPSANHR